MVIIVEGIDRVGKTTLCNMLSKELNIPIFKDESFYEKGAKSKEIEIERMSTAIAMIKSLNADVIIDRFMWSEFVYGKLNRGYINSDVYKLERKLLELDNVFVILVKPTNVNKSSVEHGESMILHNEEFEKMLDRTILPTVICDFSRLSDAVGYIKLFHSYNNNRG